MALYGVSLTLTYIAWDTDNNIGKTGDASNHTLRWIKDGTASAPTNSPVEVDATNAPGIYKITLTTTETEATYGTLAGKSSSSNVSILPVSVAFEQVPTQAIADAVWDEARSEHTATGTYGAVSEWAGGSGDRTIGVTVTDGTDPLESATVRMTKGSESYAGKTDESGQVTFYLDDGTWTITATLGGYFGTSTTHVVDSNETPLEIELTKATITPSPANTVTGYATVLDEQGSPESGVVCGCALVQLPLAGSEGIVADSTEQTSISDANGLVQFLGLIPGAYYLLRRGATHTRVNIPSTATDPYELPSWYGSS